MNVEGLKRFALTSKKTKVPSVNSILFSDHEDFFLAFFAVLMLVTNIEISSLFS